MRTAFKPIDAGLIELDRYVLANLTAPTGFTRAHAGNGAAGMNVADGFEQHTVARLDIGYLGVKLEHVIWPAHLDDMNLASKR